MTVKRKTPEVEFRRRPHCATCVDVEFGWGDSRHWLDTVEDHRGKTGHTMWLELEPVDDPQGSLL